MVPTVLLLASACGSNGSSAQSTSTTSPATPGASASQSATASGAALTPQRVLPVFLQCLTDHNITIWDKAEGNVSVASLGQKEGWYRDGKVVANQTLYSDADAIEGFYPIGSGFKPQQMIGDWVDNAVSNGTWPKVCAPLPTAS